MVVLWMTCKISLLFLICVRASVLCERPDERKVKFTSGIRKHVIENTQHLPEEYMNTSQIIQYRGYPVQEHVVVTDDGYILSVQRIPKGRKGIPPNGEIVFLQHGLVASSADWVLNSESESLGFILADLGYDVWLGNSRGNTYSKRHLTLSTEDSKFWAFSWDEMGKYDLPACFHYIQNITGKSQLFYIGHSQGTTMAFAEFSRNPDVAKRIKGFFALAPVTSASHIKGLIKLLSDIPELQFLLKILGVKEFAPSNSIMKWFADAICDYTMTRETCSQLIFVICGPDTKNLNETRLGVYAAHTPAGTSVQNMVHWSQDKFSQERSPRSWDSFEHHPPLYNVSMMDVPTAIFTGSNDWLADPRDVAVLKPQIKNLIYEKNEADWNHLDLVWGTNANKRIYPDIIRLMKKISKGHFG